MFYYLALILILCPFMATGHMLRLVIPNFPPLTYFSGGKPQGEGVVKVSQLLENMQVNYVISSVPNYARAFEEVRLGRADGFFLASQNVKRDRIALMSHSVMNYRWSWFLTPNARLSPNHPDFKTKARIGSLFGTNTHYWLSAKDYPSMTCSKKATTLVSLLLKLKRLDAVFLAEPVFIDAARKKGIAANDYQQVVEIDQPFGIYISLFYLVIHPNFMSELNTEIASASLAQD